MKMFFKSVSFLGITFILLSLALNSSSTLMERALERSIQAVVNGGKAGRLLKIISEDLDLKNFLLDPSISAQWDQPKISAFCTTCTITMGQLLDVVHGNHSDDAIADAAINVCVQLGLGNDIFCSQFIHLAQPEITYIVNAAPDLTAKDVCGTMFSSQGCVSNNPERIYNISLPDVPKPNVSEPEYPDPNSVPTLRVLHLADTHVDPEYSPGSNTQCPEQYLCCRDDGSALANPEDAAGFWGDYRNCDTPMWTLEAMYQHIAATHTDIDFIIWTGDLIPHDVWETDRPSNIAVIEGTAELLQQYFPGVDVFPAVGNHEGNPVNSFPQPYIDEPDFDISWLYDTLVSVWSYWLPDDVATSIAYGAYYSTLIRPGLRIISINSQYCYCLNWWLLLDSHDVAEELVNLANELQMAEDAGESVYIIGHIPPGNDDCHATWSHEYNRVISRYEDTVTGLFYGHTHKDHYHVFFDPGTDRAHDIGYIAQSQTPYSSYNPGYKIYTIEGDFLGSRYRVLDHDNYIVDLDEANANNFTRFFKLYDAKDQYELIDLSPQSWTDLVYTMAKPNSTVFDDFYRNYVKAGRPALEKGCDEKCKSNVLCRLLRSDSSDESHCEGL